MKKLVSLIAISFQFLFLSCNGVDESINKPNIIIIFVDDMGYADIGCNGIRTDNKTPNIDALAESGIRMTAGYASAPQCVPSRAGILTGQYQNKFGLEENRNSPLPIHITTIADRIKKQGYTTGLVGKWHLGISPHSKKWLADNNYSNIAAIDSIEYFRYFPWNRGFETVFCGYGPNGYANIDLKGNSLSKVTEYAHKKYRLDLQTEAALSFIKSNKDNPFFLFLSYFGPHTPLNSTKKYLDRFTNDMPNRRRLALAMNAAIDDGVGNVVKMLKDYKILDNTIIFFVSDNGAPLIIQKEDAPITKKTNLWNGSLNDPWVGEKGMLTEGGIRVPFIIYWKKKLPKNQVYEHPVSCLDISMTAVALAGGELDNLDGVNLIPYLNGSKLDAPHNEIYWRWRGQEAVRNDKYKYLRYSDGKEYLFDLESNENEKNNIIESHRKIAVELESKLDDWGKTLLKNRYIGELSRDEEIYRYHYLIK